MSFRPPKTLPDFASLKATFVGAKDQIKDYLLFQTIVNLVDASGKSQSVLGGRLSDVEVTVNNNTTVIADQIHPFLVMGG